MRTGDVVRIKRGKYAGRTGKVIGPWFFGYAVWIKCEGPEDPLWREFHERDCWGVLTIKVQGWKMDRLDGGIW
jgi:hypothetical protein